ncbi:hypothetical protein VNO78_22780 [Psophocarpus tetragonolobus]|uniref:Uncharacterized protein n=1 Tax=Psophocarpus tetragonolobus TaxID=3891 RepID=A0AAN9S2W2_PSOTE
MNISLKFLLDISHYVGVVKWPQAHRHSRYAEGISVISLSFRVLPRPYKFPFHLLRISVPQKTLAQPDLLD